MAKMLTASGKAVEVLMANLCGKRVRTRRVLRNGYVTIPAGTVCIVDHLWRLGAGLNLVIADPCPHCGAKWHISRVRRDDVLLVDE